MAFCHTAPVPADKELAASHHPAVAFSALFDQLEAFTSLSAKTITATVANHPVDLAIGVSCFIGTKHLYAMGVATERKILQRRSKLVPRA